MAEIPRGNIFQAAGSWTYFDFSLVCNQRVEVNTNVLWSAIIETKWRRLFLFMHHE